MQRLEGARNGWGPAASGDSLLICGPAIPGSVSPPLPGGESACLPSVPRERSKKRNTFRKHVTSLISHVALGYFRGEQQREK